VSLGHHFDRRRPDAETLGSDGNLVERFFAGYVADLSLSRYRRQRAEQQGRLADARVAANQDDRTRDQTATEDAIEFRHSTGRALGLVGVNRIQSGELCAPRKLRETGPITGLPAFGKRIPAAAVCALSLPLSMLGPTLPTGENSLRFRHSRAA
jgi:hypothetical protein